MDLRQYLESHEALESDALFCGIDAKSRALLHLAAREILASASDFETLAEIDAAIVLGDKEVEQGTISVRERFEGDQGSWPVQKMVDLIADAVV